MILFYFPPFLTCEKHSMRKGFSKFLKKRFKFRGFYFPKSTQKLQNRENFYTRKFLRLRYMKLHFASIIFAQKRNFFGTN